MLRPSSLFYRAHRGPCVQTSASWSNNSAPKETAVGARRQINAATSELLTKVKGILILTAADGEKGSLGAAAATRPHKSLLRFRSAVPKSNLELVAIGRRANLCWSGRGSLLTAAAQTHYCYCSCRLCLRLHRWKTFVLARAKTRSFPPGAPSRPHCSAIPGHRVTLHIPQWENANIAGQLEQRPVILLDERRGFFETLATSTSRW